MMKKVSCDLMWVAHVILVSALGPNPSFFGGLLFNLGQGLGLGLGPGLDNLASKFEGRHL